MPAREGKKNPRARAAMFWLHSPAKASGLILTAGTVSSASRISTALACIRPTRLPATRATGTVLATYPPAARTASVLRSSRNIAGSTPAEKSTSAASAAQLVAAASHAARARKTERPKRVSAVRPDGTQPHLLAAYDVTAGTVLGQASVGAKTNEITCFVPLLHAILHSPRASSPDPDHDHDHDGDHDGDGDGDDAGAGAGEGEGEGEEGEELVIVTADALHTQAGHVEAMNKLRVGWILDLKGNQPGLYALAAPHPGGDEPVLHATAEVGHGRHEIRTIRVTSQVPDGVTRRFPDRKS